MNTSEAKLYEIFDALRITDYTVREHAAVFTIDEVEAHGLSAEGFNSKNLLIREKKSNRFFLVILEEHVRMDLKHFKEVTGWRQVRFANEEELWELLKLTPGSVTPLSLFHDEEKRITVVLGKDLAEAADEEPVHFHPCRNTATLTMRKHDFMKFLEFAGNEIIMEKTVASD